MNKKIAVFPGSFDPITIGHEKIVRRSLQLFDEVVIAIGHNSSKSTTYSLDERIEQLKLVFADEPRISTAHYEGLTIDFCKRIDAHFILRGLRTAADFEYERTISVLNMTMEEDIETVFLISQPEYSAVSSTIVREIIRAGGNVNPFLPKALHK